APGMDLATKLTTAADCPRDDRGPKRGAVPQLFRAWAPSAWRDLLMDLPDEEQASEISDAAREEFRARLAGALSVQIALAYIYNKRGADRTEVERRSLIAWCQRFARSGRWENIRSYCIWTRLVPPSASSFLN